MAYQPIHEGSFDVAIEDGQDLGPLLGSIFSRYMVIVGWKADAGAGYPEVTIRGTRAQFVSWFRGFYDPDGSGIGAPEGCDDDALWHTYREAGFVKFVA